MVFAPDAAPRAREDFLDWYEAQAEWEEDHGYDDPAVSTPALRAWFLDMIAAYPPLNGPHAKEELPEDEASATDYSIGKSLVYASFSWSKSEQAYEDAFRLAAKHGLGFFNASSDLAEVWLPDGKAGLILAHSG